jgi:hypothetical protein
MDSTLRVDTLTTTDLPVTLPSRFPRVSMKRSLRRSCVPVSRSIFAIFCFLLTTSILRCHRLLSVEPLRRWTRQEGRNCGSGWIGWVFSGSCLCPVSPSDFLHFRACAGHLGIQFSKALGAETYALSTSKSKEADCKAMGATDILITKDPKAVLKEHAGTFDLLIGTSFAADMPFDTLFLPLLKPRGHIVQVGLPEERLPGIMPQAILGKSITGSLIGSPAEIKKMFEIAVKHDIKPWIQERPMADAQQAVQGKSNLLRLGISSLILVHP